MLPREARNIALRCVSPMVRPWLILFAGCIALTLLHIVLPKWPCDSLTPLPWLRCF